MDNNNMGYYGWVEISIDKQGEKLLVHRVALSKEAQKVVKAGF